MKCQDTFTHSRSIDEFPMGLAIPAVSSACTKVDDNAFKRCIAQITGVAGADRVVLETLEVGVVVRAIIYSATHDRTLHYRDDCY